MQPPASMQPGPGAPSMVGTPVAGAAATPPAVPPVEGGGAGAMQPMMPVTPDEPTMPGDNCEERRVSYARPCTTDPDPCKLNSGWPGDEYCLVPPPEGTGVQIHVGPSNYQDQAEVMKYVIRKGEEFNNSVIGHIPLEEMRYFQRITVHMRPGSHHWISRTVTGKPEARFYTGTDCGGASANGSLGGGQNLIYDNPPGGIPAPENAGLGRTIQGQSSLCMNLHAYNFSEEDQLREMWINLYFIEEADITQRATGIGMVGGLGLNLPAGESTTLTYMGTFDSPGRIIQLFGHRHVWTPRFAVWLNDDLIYDSWDWQESVTFNYDTLTMNPPINTDGMVDGAVSGQVPVEAGDTLKFSCFIENESDQTLRFSNELYGGEMCNLWGSAVGSGLSGTFF
jgi:hypothetical protein